MPRETILILTGNYGDGHRQTAAALEHSLRYAHPLAETAVVDVMELTRPYFQPIARYLFLQGVKKAPSIYGYLYRRTRRATPLSRFLKRFNRAGADKLLKLLGAMRPSVVVSTFPIAAGLMSLIKSERLSAVPTATVITDYTVHSYWVYPCTDLYLVGSQEVSRELASHSVAGGRIAVTGIPVRPEFALPYDRAQMRLKHGLDPELPTVLLMGGGLGLIDGEQEHLQALEALAERAQLIVVCGHNEKLRRLLAGRTGRTGRRMSVLGYVDCIPELMAAADMLVTKAGGLTVSEALTMRVPIILYKPLPGQEQENAAYLTRSDAALLAGSLNDLTGTIRSCIRYPVILRQLKDNAARIASDRAAEAAAERIWQLRREQVGLEYG